MVHNLNKRKQIRSRGRGRETERETRAGGGEECKQERACMCLSFGQHVHYYCIADQPERSTGGRRRQLCAMPWSMGTDWYNVAMMQAV